MARLLYLSPIFAVVGTLFYFIFLKSPPPVPKLDVNEWWGPSSLKGKTDDKIRPFKVEFKAEMIKDLKARLNATRPLTPPLENIGFQYGINHDYLNTLIKYWLEEYPFAEREKFINQYPMYKTYIQGLSIHYVHIKPKVPAGVEVLPLLMMSGFTGSFLDFYQVAGPLTTYKEGSPFAVELILPSIPGFGFSDGEARPGLGPVEMAVVMRNLMHRLGHKKFYVQGGNWGGIIAPAMATLFPEEVLGQHNNGVFLSSPKVFLIEALISFWPTLFMDAAMADRIYPMSDFMALMIEEMGYLHIQATKPDTVGVGLTDSPAGLLAYTVEKFAAWTNIDYRKLPDGGIPRHFTKNQLIDNAMIYWTANSINTAIKIYSEFMSQNQLSYMIDDIPTPVPTWIIQAKYELGWVPEFLLRFVKYPNLLNNTLLDKGGVFLPLELPEVFANDVMKSLKAFREWHKTNTVKTEL